MGPMGAADDALVGKAFNPLAGDVELDVTPATTTVYGYVRDADEFPVEDVIVTVNGVEAPPTDEHGRYIAEYVGSDTRKIDDVTHSKRIFVETNHEENEATLTYTEAFAANRPDQRGRCPWRRRQDRLVQRYGHCSRQRRSDRRCADSRGRRGPDQAEREIARC